MNDQFCRETQSNATPLAPWSNVPQIDTSVRWNLVATRQGADFEQGPLINPRAVLRATGSSGRDKFR